MLRKTPSEGELVLLVLMSSHKVSLSFHYVSLSVYRIVHRLSVSVRNVSVSVNYVSLIFLKGVTDRPKRVNVSLYCVINLL